MKKHSGSLALLLVALLAAAPSLAQAHAFPKTAAPAIDGTVSPAPSEVKIWFTGKLEPAFSKLDVHDAVGTAVDRGDASVEIAALTPVAPIDLSPATPAVHVHEG